MLKKERAYLLERERPREVERQGEIERQREKDATEIERRDKRK